MFQGLGSTNEFAPRDPDFREVVASCFNEQSFMRSIHAELLEVEAGFCRLRLKCVGMVLQQNGFVHGGVVGAMADSAGGCAALSLAAPGQRVLTVEYSVRFLRPAVGSELIAEGRVVRPGRTLTACTISVCLDAANENRICAFGAQTVNLLSGPRSKL